MEGFMKPLERKFELLAEMTVEDNPLGASHNHLFNKAPVPSVVDTETFPAASASTDPAMSNSSLRINIANTSTAPRKDDLKQKVEIALSK